MPCVAEDLPVRPNATGLVEFVTCEPEGVDEQREGRKGKRSGEHETDLEPVGRRSSVGFQVHRKPTSLPGP
ncbi:hypothetical protein D9M70_503300 [compost metagenome]